MIANPSAPLAAVRPLLLLVVFLLAHPRAHAARLFFTDQPAGAAGSVISLGLDGTDQRTLLTITNAPDVRGIAWHRASSRVFFLDNGAAKAIFSMTAEGSNLQHVVDISPTLLNSDLEIDEANGHLYWTENNPTTTGYGYIQRANLDGTGVTNIVTTVAGPATAPYFLFLDTVGGHIYWGVASEGSVSSSFRRATFAGVTDPDFLLTTATRTRDLGLDPTTATFYWCDRQMGTIYRRSVTGGVNQVVISGLNAPHGIALDSEAGKVYWADTGARGSGVGISARRVARCNFDGSEYENLSTPTAFSEAWDLALDLACPTYADWRSRFFSTNSPAAGPLDDADGDGAPNLLEYALGTHPRNVASLPRLAPAERGLQFPRRRGANLTYRVEASTDLATWHHNQDGSSLEWTIEVAVTPRDGDWETVVVTAGAALANAPQAYFRLRVTTP